MEAVVWTRRKFLVASGATAGVVALGTAGCASDDSDGADEIGEGGMPTDEATEDEVAQGEGSVDAVITDDDVPTAATIFGWISEIFDQGIRRPGYPANQWAEDYIADHFRTLAMENVRLEPVTVTRWEPLEWTLEVITGDGEPTELACFPLPNAAPVDGLEVALTAFDPDNPAAVAGKASLYDVSLIGIPADLFATAGSAPDETTGRVVDPDGTLDEATHLVPFGAEFQEVMEPSMDAGAAAFIGSLKNYPGDSYQYFVPYDGVERPIPGVWISGSDGDWLEEQLTGRDEHNPVRVRLTVESNSERVESYNVVGELPGDDDQMVIIGSHHDGPWASAVEDASGMALVLAQATYWAAQPQQRRPHRLVFVMQAGHMDGGAGLRAFVERHRDELDDVVLQVHLEHAALEFREDHEGEPAPTGRPEPRWFFTSRIAQLEQAVFGALTIEELHRSMLVAPDAFGEAPPTDGAFYYLEGVPIMHFLAAPFYLFDAMDTLDKIDRDNLVPLTRATIRIVESTRETSAAAMRAAQFDKPAP